ncbi:MAG: Gingipain R, partial [Bacteroidetes bacterium]|nr:Gingipain R [Bacteroidota bacterium]
NSLSEIKSIGVKTNSETFSELTAPDYGWTTVVGDPKLPVLKKIIEVPYGAECTVEILSQASAEYQLQDIGILHRILPAQAPVSKSIENPEDIPFVLNTATYSTNAYLGNELVKVVMLGEMRGIHLARLEISPVEYNPVAGKIKVYYDLDVQVSFAGADEARTVEMKKNNFSPYFQGIFGLISNYKEVPTDELIMDEPVTYIIVADPMFTSALLPFIQWKTKKGFKVYEAYTNNPNVGTTTTTIKAFLQNFYNAPPAGYSAQSFVLLVGDVAQIPTFTGTAGSHVSDLYYCTYGGTGDIFPECYYGRFSATSIAQLQPQIDKTLQYEQYLMPDPSFLDEVLMVAGDDESYEDLWANGQINYGTAYYFNSGHGLYSHTFLQDPPTGNAAIHDSIIANMNGGIGYGNYTAHCSSIGWASPSFSQSDIASLTNINKYPLLVGNCCLSVTFNSSCFGEDILRAANKGALGYIGGSNNTYWDEDFWWGCGYKTVAANPPYNASSLGAYDRTFHDHGEPLAEWYITQGQMPSAGNLAVSQSGSSLATYYWEIYHLMGDPSVMIYFSQPPVTTASYAALMPLGATTFNVQTQPYAYVAISKDNVLYGAAIADASGLAEV